MALKTRKQAFIFYTIILVIGLVVAYFPIGNQVLNWLSTILVFIGVITYLLILPYCCTKKEGANRAPQPYQRVIPLDDDVQPLSPPDNDEPADVQLQVVVNEKPESVSIPEPTKKASKRLYYMDNLRTFLTVMVIMHHVTCTFANEPHPYMLARYYHSFMVPGMAFLYINQSYFMSLFFFISGYFTPLSYDKKGPTQFMADKLKRLGIPYLVYTLCLSPLLSFTVIKGLINYGTEYTYNIEAAHCWFLLWLLIFNACYLVMDQTVPIYIAKLPSLLKLILIGFALSIPQLILVVFVVPDRFIFMPITLGSLPFDILFFCGGVMAKRNDWLRSLNQYNSVVVGVLMALYIIIITVITVVTYTEDLGGMLWTSMPQKDQSTDCDAQGVGVTIDRQALYEYMLSVPGIPAFVQLIVSGAGTIVMSLGVLQFAEKYWNYTSNWTKFLSEQSYAVYLIHFWVIVPVAWMWVQIMENQTGITLEFCGTKSYTHFASDYLVYIGWLYTTVLSLIIVWPLAWFIRQIPGVNRII